MVETESEHISEETPRIDKQCFLTEQRNWDVQSDLSLVLDLEDMEPKAIVYNNDRSDSQCYKGARDIQELILLPRAPSSFTLDRLPQMFPVCITSRAKRRINRSLDFKEE